MKDLKISKELLSEVLEVEISDFNIIGNTLNYIIPNYETEEDGDLIYIDLGQNINIYEFAFKCKRWAKTKNYVLWSYLDQTNMFNFDGIKVKSFIGNEVETIIKACEWILNGK